MINGLFVMDDDSHKSNKYFNFNNYICLQQENPLFVIEKKYFEYKATNYLNFIT